MSRIETSLREKTTTITTTTTATTSTTTITTTTITQELPPTAQDSPRLLEVGG